MVDFEAPSFSLGLDDDLHDEQQPPDTSFLISNNDVPSSVPENAPGVAPDSDHDSDFDELASLPDTTHTVLKRLRRKSSQKPSFGDSPPVAVPRNGKGLFQLSLKAASSNEKKSKFSTDKTPQTKNAPGKVQTLQNFWKNLTPISVPNKTSDAAEESIENYSTPVLRQTLNFPGLSSVENNKKTCTYGQHFGVIKNEIIEDMSEDVDINIPRIDEQNKDKFIVQDSKSYFNQKTCLAVEPLLRTNTVQSSETTQDVSDDCGDVNLDSKQKNQLSNCEHEVQLKECSTNDSVDVPNEITAQCPVQISLQTKTTALGSFWKSLNSNKPETSGRGLDDDIEDFSSEDDFEISTTPSARKLSLCGNTAVLRNFALHNASSDRRNSDKFFVQSSKNTPPKYTSTSMQCTPKESIAKSGSSQHFTSQSVQLDFSGKFSESQKLADRFSTPGHGQYNHQWDDLNTVETPFFSSKAHGSSRIDPQRSSLVDFLKQRFPHFISVGSLRNEYSIEQEPVYIDYENQFGENRNIAGESGNIILKQQQSSRTKQPTQRKQGTRKRQKTSAVESEGWVCTGNRANQSRSTSQAWASRSGDRTPMNNAEGSGTGSGHWITDGTGKKVYVTKDGKKLSGSSAYKQHMKDSGKRIKKTKRRRPRGK